MKRGKPDQFLWQNYTWQISLQCSEGCLPPPLRSKGCRERRYGSIFVLTVDSNRWLKCKENLASSTTPYVYSHQGFAFKWTKKRKTGSIFTAKLYVTNFTPVFRGLPTPPLRSKGCGGRECGSRTVAAFPFSSAQEISTRASTQPLPPSPLLPFLIPELFPWLWTILIFSLLFFFFFSTRVVFSVNDWRRKTSEVVFRGN